MVRTVAGRAGAVTAAADFVRSVESDDVGVVTAVGAGSITITDGVTGQPDGFVADPSQQMFSGVSVGDEVDVTFHQSTGQLIADNVDDLTDNGTWNS